MANRYWVGGTGNWNDTSHWTDSFVEMTGYIARSVGTYENTLVIESITGTLTPGMTAYISMSDGSNGFRSIADHNPLGTISFTGTGTGGVGTYSHSLGTSLPDNYKNTPLRFTAHGATGASVPTYTDDVFVLQTWPGTGSGYYYINTPPSADGAFIHMKSLTANSAALVVAVVGGVPTSDPANPNKANGEVYIYGSVNCPGAILGYGNWYLGSTTPSQTYTVSGRAVSGLYFKSLTIGHDRYDSTFSNCSTCTWNFTGRVGFIPGFDEALTLTAGRIGVASGATISPRQFLSTSPIYSRGVDFSGGAIFLILTNTTTTPLWDVDAASFTCTGTGVIAFPYSGQFRGNSIPYSGVTLLTNEAGILTITGSNTFYNINNTDGVASAVGTVEFEPGSVTTVTKFDLHGNKTYGAYTIRPIGGSSAQNFTLNTTSSDVTSSYLSITNSTATPSGVFAAINSINATPTTNTGWGIYQRSANVSRGLGQLTASSTSFREKEANSSVTLGTLSFIGQSSKTGPIIFQVRESAAFVEREPRNSVAFSIRETAGPFTDLPTSVTTVYLLEQATVNDNCVINKYPLLRESAVVSSTASIAIKRSTKYTEVALLKSKATGGRRLSHTERDTALLNDAYAYLNDVFVRDRALLHAQVSPYTVSRVTAREIAKLKGRAVVPAGLVLREIATLSTVAAVNVARGSLVREVAQISSVSQLTLRAAARLAEVARLSGTATINMFVTALVLDPFYVSDDLSSPISISAPSSTTSGDNAQSGMAAYIHNSASGNVSYTCSIACWAMSILTNDGEQTITTGLMDMGGAQLKRPSAVYVNGESSAPLTVTVAGDCNGVAAVSEYTLELRDQADYRSNRALIGKGFRSRYLQLKLDATGTDYRLISADIDVAVSNRRV